MEGRLLEVCLPHFVKINFQAIKPPFRTSLGVQSLTVVFVCRLWGSTIVIFCHHCRCYFPCTDLGHCKYHARPVEYKGVESDDNPMVLDIHPCCQQKALRYDSINVLTVSIHYHYGNYNNNVETMATC